MPPIYSNPIAKLREWADAVRLDHPDVWNDLEDLAQSFEALSDAGSHTINEARAAVRAIKWRNAAVKNGWDSEDTDAVKEAIIIADGTDEALSILGCGSVADLVAEDVATEIRKAAIKAKFLNALVEEIVTALDIPASWLEYDSALVAGDLPRFQKWCAGVLAAVRRPDAEVIQGQASGLAELANEAEALRAELAQVKEELYTARVAASKRALVIENVRRAIEVTP